MFDPQDYTIPQGKKAVLITITCPVIRGHETQNESDLSLGELKELMRTLDIEFLEIFSQNKKHPDPATVIGRGKLEDIAQTAKGIGADLLIFDFELSPGQARNIKKITELEAIDRCHVILEIFARHARTAEAKIQIEMAKLEYLLPRLTSFWGHFSRQKGGVGMRGGEGEQQLELDRRIIRNRISQLKKQQENIKVSRLEQRKRRKDQVITAALVGYTNAGKSSLMNRLCRVNVLEENKLFATLDSTYRTLNPDSKPPMILIDTVGFLSNLPNTLIDGFKTTLESALEADLLIIVCDISSPHYKKHLQTTEEVLEELGVSQKKRFIVFNKKDQFPDEMAQQIALRNYPHSFMVSSFDPEDMDSLRQEIINYFLGQQELIDLFLPYEDGQAHSRVAQYTNIVHSENNEKGIYYRVRAPQGLFASLNLHEFVLANK